MAWLRGVPTVDRALEQEIDGFVRVEKQTKADTKSVWGIIREYLVYNVLIGKLWLFPMVDFHQSGSVEYSTILLGKAYQIISLEWRVVIC